MAINRTSPKKGKVIDIPDAVVTIGAPTAGDSQVSVAFTASSPATGGPVQKYTAISSPGSFTGTATTSPVVVTGLTNDTAYTFTVAAANATGTGVFSSASASATPVSPYSFDSIATVTVGAGGSTYIDFTSIPQTYKHLQIRWIARDTTNDGAGIYWQYNADTATNYNRHLLRGNGSAVAASGYSSGQTKAGCGYMLPNSANIFAMGVIDISDYTNANKYKASKMIGGYDNNSSGFNLLSSSVWMSTSGITSIKLQCETTFGQYSQFALYGIKG